MTNEIRYKENLLLRLLEEKRLDAIVLSKKESFSWVTGGKVNYIYMASEFGVVDLVFTKNQKYCVTSKYERYRIMEEELAGLDYQIVEYDWWKQNRVEVVKGLVGNGVIGSDWDMGGLSIYLKI